MPISARLDAPGVLHHIIIRGIERGNIFRDNKDRDNFIDHLSDLLPETQTACYAWAFIPQCIVLGIDPIYKPKLRLCFVGRYGRHSHHRKGLDIIDVILKLPFVEVIRTCKYKKNDLPGLYQSVDYILVTSRYEGGPMCLLESIACGKKVICPIDVGLAGQFREHIIHYKNGSVDSLIHILEELYQEKVAISETVKKYTWDNWAKEHIEIFKAL